MSNKIIFGLIGIFVALAILPIVVSAEESYIFKQNTQVDLKIPVFTDNNVPAPSTTICNITITRPDGVVLINNRLMTWNQAYYNYTLTPAQTFNIGEYPSTISCKDTSTSNGGFSTFTYLITPGGNKGLLGMYFFIFLLALGLIIFGFTKDDPWTVILGGFIFVSLGLFTLINGIDVYRNTVTEAVSLIVTLVGGYIGVRSALEVVTENL